MPEHIPSQSDSDALFAVNVEVAVYRELDEGRREWLMGMRSDAEEHAGGDLVMPGGTVEPQTNGRGILEATAVREAAEECNVKIAEPFYVASDFFRTGKGANVLNVIFGAEHASGEPTALDPEEMTSLHWLTLAEISNHPNAQPWTIENIRRADEVLCRKLGRVATN